MLKCLECGYVFNEGEELEVVDHVGDFWKDPAYQVYHCCPKCGGGFEELERCEICGEEHSADELAWGVCSDCLESATLEEYLAINGDGKSEISINAILAYSFSESEIEEILLRELRLANEIKPVSCLDYINQDKSWFAERLIEVRKAVK